MQHLATKSAVSYRKQALRGKSFARADGFSLIEVLVSIIILSFGLLGMVGLQAAALQSNRDARLQSVAGTLARELAEMMRGNNSIAILPQGAANPYLGQFNTVPLVAANPSYCLNVSTATPVCLNNTEVAQAQMTEWLARVNDALPSAQVTVCADGSPYDAQGLPQWPCAPGVGLRPNTYIKIGWTRGSTDRTQQGALALDMATRPSLILPITPGNSS
jgi:type IV pilus assembly protein PilV